ncbi:MAG: glycosyltransferase family 2 protein [Thomasclavelia sp.]|uniref:glycosyltransferase family 2 protein n=1 Tax=Thomasclavelia sp. TaxID=3025757 RepID=UPI0039A03C5C
MADLTTIILTFNEEKNIANAINSVKSISKRIVIVDSFSTDKTVEIAESLGAEVIQHEFVNQAKQFIYAMNILDIKTIWIMRLDADEIISKNAAKEIEGICNININSDINGIVVRFEVNFLGKALKHGGIYPFRKMIVFKNGKGYMEDRNMDEHIVLLEGKAIETKNDSYHKDYKNLSTWIDKHNKYSSREVNDYFDSYKNNKSVNLNKSARFKRFIKFKIYYKLPLGTRAHLYYFYRYYFKLGFLDGKEGKIFAFMQAYWYRFLVDAKIYEHVIDDKKEV